MLERILCAIFGHRYVVERHIAAHWRKVGCTRCRQSWGMHDPTRAFVLWDGEQAELADRLHPHGVDVREEALRVVGAAGPLGDPDVLAAGVEGRKS